MTSRPEHVAPPEIFYGEAEAKKYTRNTRIISIQNEMTYRAIELLALPEDKSAYILDIGCGSGLSGEVLEDEGHVWVGLDISKSMLDVAVEREVEGDLFEHDIGHGLGFRPATFDGAISISVLQWLCNADKQSHVPRRRLHRFFTTLYTSLCRGARAVFQFYPESPAQIEMIVASAMKAGFTGGLVVDYPNSSKAKKYYLCLFAGVAANSAEKTQELPKGLDEEGQSVSYSDKRVRERYRKGAHHRVSVKDKDWIQRKKNLARARGKDTAQDSKFTGRKRGPRF
ncbi:hypothetical protein BATDEDRAFT_86964 [Batrachochytrium dendrobatidis JAM81]|uniref:18S rRNA (guanine(1575)-N(7))-methyltransferase Bud23 C-terminal domain-containing protein n=2 Tax=Batrachochytrium dendrobatidis TaxID=109871 RepID=F4NXV2_BATDJ|nr:18S rRNA (guanine1575-N7)-methyltransferase [Batrachochytrium dendrobatidis JAM81]EGF82205.1 hypothetical protein BATDEDRAFT_86964 [Batrachochytrium dendrobatidis JAM81]KAJ8324488.1 18S rRNA (guanine1575-N7)-methyltransferase [Batrachochytrium dendrobatidis]KAK5670736.1 18S rRNA (guanine1575-N7)-methyltransferase [Batrachochytrium dendrobatidis]|eukprot:XP_006677667.1 hypothetical protein BATDEDRAFT_86964 [Batrachochytrium dendrobatidis JAM81]